MSVDEGLDLPMTGNAEVDETHELQIRLLEAIEKALGGSDRDRALELLNSLEDYSDAHFAAEQILMRLHSYPGYHAHIAEHGRLIGELEVLRDRISVEDEEILPSEAATVRRWLLTHIRTADKAFANYLEKSPVDADAARG
ncbi:MAG: hemerythrin family protein [Thermoanaerobaculia bacterium]|nr:hemerythrin family protein [Thermoanaerobaculia bacterium]